MLKVIMIKTINKPVTLVLIAAIVSLFLIATLKESNSNDLTNIDINQISIVFGRKSPIDLPEWGILSVQKYDDGFTFPSVFITYKNGITLQISQKEMDYSGYEPIKKTIGSSSVNIYKLENKVFYRLYNNIGYSFEMRENNQILLVEEFILSLN